MPIVTNLLLEQDDDDLYKEIDIFKLQKFSSRVHFTHSKPHLWVDFGLTAHWLNIISLGWGAGCTLAKHHLSEMRGWLHIR